MNNCQWLHRNNLHINKWISNTIDMKGPSVEYSLKNVFIIISCTLTFRHDSWIFLFLFLFFWLLLLLFSSYQWKQWERDENNYLFIKEKENIRNFVYFSFRSQVLWTRAGSIFKQLSFSSHSKQMFSMNEHNFNSINYLKSDFFVNCILCLSECFWTTGLHFVGNNI